MIELLSRVTMTCFTTSYLVAFVLEATRPWMKLPVRRTVILTFTILGLSLHFVFFVMRAQPTEMTEGGLLVSWFDWSLVLAWCLAACYLIYLLRSPRTTVGLFLLPPVLAMIGLAWTLRNAAPFSREEAVGIWRNVHAVAVLAGTVAVLLGFIAGVMYLIQSARLKQKKASREGFRLPTLEGLQRLNRRCLYFSTTALAVGLIAGFVMNLNRWGYVGWTERGVVFSGVLLLWLVAASLFEWLYKPARTGRKVAYLTLASFGFLVLALAAVLTSPHGRPEASPSSALRSPLQRIDSQGGTKRVVSGGGDPA